MPWIGFFPAGDDRKGRTQVVLPPNGLPERVAALMEALPREWIGTLRKRLPTQW